MMEIKICGITNCDDALHAAQCGANALGFIFYPKSARYIKPAEASVIINRLPDSVARVGVFVNQDVAEIKDIASSCRLDIIQLHGDESPEYCRHFPAALIVKAFTLKHPEDLKALHNYNVKAFLVDSREGELYGGTGKTTNCELAFRAARTFPLILAGGLNEENIEKAMDRVSSGAVDINSGVEISPGKKDHEKVQRIINIIRKHDESGPARAGILTVKR
jgi:phosphoribosylanthranilate isomerase